MDNSRGVIFPLGGEFMDTCSLLTSDWGSAIGYLSHRLLEIVLISLSEFLNSVFTVETLSDNFIGLHKLVDLSGEFVVLVGDNSNMIVQ